MGNAIYADRAASEIADRNEVFASDKNPTEGEVGEQCSEPVGTGLTPFWWTFLMRRAETRENVHDDSASKTLIHARVQGTDR
jgi:hypothetical protein